jgi:hypothetical protein
MGLLNSRICSCRFSLRLRLEMIRIPMRGKGSKSAPHLLDVENLHELATWKKSVSKFNLKADEHELSLLGSFDNRVKGLSGTDIGGSEEDMLSDEVQGS